MSSFNLLRSKSELQPLDRMSDKLKLGRWSFFGAIHFLKELLAHPSFRMSYAKQLTPFLFNQPSFGSKGLHEISHSNNCMVWSQLSKERNSFSQCILDWGWGVSKKGCDVEKILQDVDIHPTENIYNLNISITRLYVQVLLW